MSGSGTRLLAVVVLNGVLTGPISLSWAMSSKLRSVQVRRSVAMTIGLYTAANPTVGHLRYAFVGNATRCLNSCAIQSVGPNGNAGVDAMVSVIAHELAEMATDPDLNAWYDSRGYENADKCAWTFGHFQYQVANGAWANVHLGSRDYEIQRNLSHNRPGPDGVGDYCMMDGMHN